MAQEKIRGSSADFEATTIGTSRFKVDLPYK